MPSDRRSVRNIPADDASDRAGQKAVEKARRRSSASESETEAEEVPIKRVNRIRVTPPTPPVRPKRASKASRVRKIGVGAFLAVVLVVAATAYIASTYFSRATFTIVPVTLPVAVNSATIVATGTSSPGYVRYEVVKYVGTASTTLPAADGTYISSKAAGTVTLFNTYSAQGQRLIAGTRFATDIGLVYRLSSSVFIPGYTGSGSNISPGTIRASLVADEAGSQYNMAKNDGGADLHVIAYKGGPRYETTYARAYTGMAGGFAGTKKIVNQTLLASTTADVQSALTQSLLAKALAAVPEGYVSYPSAYSTAFAPADVGGSDPRRAAVTVSGTLYSIIFKKTDLAAKLAGQESVDRFGRSPYSITGLESLQFAITNPSTFRPAKMNTLIARLTGNITLRGIVPVSELAHKLAGLPLSGTRAIFASYGSVIDISRSSGELFPSWASAVPKDEKRISLVVKDGK